MKHILFYFLFVTMIVALYGVAFARPAEDPAGKKVFVDQKCNTCHPVQAAGIETKSKKNNPDLSGIGAKTKADFLKKYLMKQEKLNDKQHPAAFKGTTEELAKLVDWIGTLKQAPKK